MNASERKMILKKEECRIKGVYLFELSTLQDERGSFCEVFRKEWIPDIFDSQTQINYSRSESGVLRGLHYHRNQTDLWIPVQGRITAGLADIRKESPTFGDSLSIEFDGGRPRGLLIPPGVAHGYAAHTDMTLIYVVNRYFDNTDEYGIAWNDPGFAIEWGLEKPFLSERDTNNSPFVME